MNPESKQASEQPVTSGSELPTDHSKKRRLTILTAIILAIAALIGAGAAAYYTVIVANEPENVLKRAVENSLRTPANGFDAKFTLEETDGPKFEVTAKGQSDGTAEAARIELVFKMDDTSIPLEIRVIGKDMYLKTDNLKELLKIEEVKTSEFADYIAQGAKVLNGQWIEIKGSDSADLGTSCYQDLELKFTEEDINLLSRRYSGVPFSTIKQVSDDTVNGRAATKYELQVDGHQIEEYAKGLDELGFIKKLKECDPTLSKALEGGEDAPSSEDLSGPLAVWVDKNSEKVTKLAVHSTEEDEKRDNVKGSLEVVLSDQTTPVERPQGDKSFMDVITQLLPQLQEFEGLPSSEGADEI